MKKLLLATAIATLSISAAQAAPKVYGKLHLAVDSITSNSGAPGADDVTTTDVMSNASRFGLKGEDELTATTSAIYMAEWGISGDISSGNDLKARNRYVGLKNTNFGTVKLGGFDTALKESQGKVDLFNDTVGELGDMKSVLTGENRAGNVIGYESPDMEGVPVKFNANLILNQEGDILTGQTKNGDNGLSMSLAYNQNGVYAALAGDKRVISKFAANSSNAFADTIRVVGQIDMGQAAGINGLTLGALYQNSKPSITGTGSNTGTGASSTITGSTATTVDKENAFVISALMAIPSVDGLAAFAQYNKSTTSFTTAGMKDLDRDQLGAGVAYSFAKNTTGYGYIAKQNLDSQSTALSPVLTAEKTIFGVSLEQKF